jgi:glycerophosphoryl diester phosphodiesterase
MAHRRGVPLAVWTVNDRATAARLLELGVRRITTNEVGDLLAWKATL